MFPTLRLKSFFRFVFSLTLTGTLLTCYALATTTLSLNPVTSSEILWDPYPTVIQYAYGFGTVSFQGLTATTSGGIDPSVSVQSVAALGNPFAGVGFQFQIVGPAGATVPILVQAMGQVSANLATGLAQEMLQIDNGIHPAIPYQWQNCEPIGGGDLPCVPASPNGSLTVNQSILEPVNQPLNAYINADVFGVGSATLDPLLEIDPTFTHAADYQLVFSPGLIANTPEPNSLLLFLIAFGLFMLWHRKKRGAGTVIGALMAAASSYAQGQVPADPTVLVAKLMPGKQREFCSLLHYAQDAEAIWQRGMNGMTGLQAAVYRRDHPDPGPRLAIDQASKLQEFLGDGHFEDWVGILTVGHAMAKDVIADTNFAFTCPGTDSMTYEIGTSQFGTQSKITLDSPVGKALLTMHDGAWVKVIGQLHVIPAPRGGIPVATRNDGIMSRHAGPSLLADLTSIRPARE